MITTLLVAELAVHHLAKAQARVEDIEGPDGDGDHDALEADEQVLAGHERAGPAVRQLGDAEHAPPEDADGAQRERAQEALEHGGAADGDKGRVLVERRGRPEGAPPPLHVQQEVPAEQHEDQQREDLEGQPRDHDVVPAVRRLALVEGDGGEGAADGLEHERDDVAGDELGGC